MSSISNIAATTTAQSYRNAQIAQNTPQQTTTDGRDRADGLGGLAGLAGSVLTRRAIANDINRVSDQIDQRISQYGPGTGTLVATTTNNATWLSKKTYAGMNVADPRTTPPSGRFDTVGRSGQTTSYTWVSANKPANLPSNVGWMTPAAFRAQAAAFQL